MNQYVAPQETRPARLATLPKLPIFMDLIGKRVLIAGGSDMVAWKAELFSAAGAIVQVYADEICHELSSLIDSGREIYWTPRRWRAGDFDHVWLAITEGGDDRDEFCASARSRGVLVNVIDQPDACDFQFGTIVNRAPVVIGISTDGAAPILGQAIRRKIEAVLPKGLGAWTAAAKQFRKRLKDIVPERAGRRRFWEAFVNVTFVSQADEDARLEKLEDIARGIANDDAPAQVGEVIIVGAGPGDPELLTMRAVRELQAADVIVYDRLVSVDALELGRREARRILVGKKGHGATVSQSDINALLVKLAKDGHRVVRLKGGDPAVFGRTSEELSALRAEKIPARVIPGVTTASAAAASLGISLTQRQIAQRVQFVTGHDSNGGLPPDLDIAALADPRATTVVYMGAKTLSILSQRLLEQGAAAETPVAIGRGVTHRGEAWDFSTVGALAASAPRGSDQPTIVIVGGVVNEAAA
ncbi:siroheme synthase [Variibacter gotjawalensis]|uniref:Siroheme synthase n=1 Tax=Variibacter gotjawalensis TaxID=1333996 RepID=A0A0S3PQU2_9BRAD|nr:siroheme synthase CysG [Variibacter gotjawalensis]NIK48599.1 uroporphyrin-III C-methyltransferase/precorrin-2 dehydrogenase/sirohydrochlorin ferrochelatase [Variibacter gotjawalensis]RZS50464.1 uroporphyrin-III C-methyltransferase/precorrin-2 dehydrogenase/sirohydrochlorin ferrochelatase [Variibacter gotjawalensis]BAT58298.1 siroheme synthase [Variibacter gotjawalensis]